MGLDFVLGTDSTASGVRINDEPGGIKTKKAPFFLTIFGKFVDKK
jgi:hypothetical protein